MDNSDHFGLKECDPRLFSFLPISDIIEYHRGAEELLTSSKPVYIYTGRGPSMASFHIGHLPGLHLCLDLQKHYGGFIEFMIADDEKIFRDGISATVMKENVRATIDQLSRLGFNEANTHYRINSAGIAAEEYQLLIQIMRITSVHTLSQIFGEKQNIGEYLYPLIQILPCFSKTHQCVVVAGKDQDPFFRLAREITRRLGYSPPVILYTRSVPGLDGSDKMSTSISASIPIYLTDTAEEVAQKIQRIKQVGAGSLDELFERGSNLDQDIPYKLLSLFDRSAVLPILRTAYTTGLTDEQREELDVLRSVIPAKGLSMRSGRTMLTSYGIRQYTTRCISGLLA